jgi:hypothetical protein
VRRTGSVLNRQPDSELLGQGKQLPQDRDCAFDSYFGIGCIAMPGSSQAQHHRGRAEVAGRPDQSPELGNLTLIGIGIVRHHIAVHTERSQNPILAL